MIPALTVILLCQLAGEVAARALGLPLPGPVIGMALLLAALVLSPRLVARVRPVAQGILGNLSLLFVPAGVGVVGHLGVLTREGPALLVALVLSTVLAIAVGALVFAAVARLVGEGDG
ncbi:CidA/LrgA family protein [Acidimangrovimonas pyrenivorans]|uniref:CidA/LrgA family protein n=1 Tax=Acidimangrovimonas pyrenivorans TaxID=2030798 RepID=A0ABV7AKW7_9RHOB